MHQFSKIFSKVGVNMYQYEENLLRANSSVAVAELPSSFLQLPPSLRLLSTTCYLGQIRMQPFISIAQSLEMLTFNVWMIKNNQCQPPPENEV